MTENDFRRAALIQEHHKKLIELFNALSAAVTMEKPEHRERMAASLLDYAIYHFRTEAEIAMKSGYTETTWDRYERETLEKKVSEIKEKVKRKELMAGSDLLLRLRELLRTHLKGELEPLGATA